MNFLLVDDEQLCLDDLRFVLEKVAPGCQCTALFRRPKRWNRHAPPI